MRHAMKYLNRHTCNKQSGYTLIELAIVMILIGVLIAPLGAAYNSYKKKQIVEETASNIAAVTSSISAFRASNGYYPCVAPQTADRTDPAYGHETDCEDVTTVPVGTCAFGYCVKQSARFLPAAPTTPVRVRVGSIPFRAMNLDEEFTFDGYGRRLTYVITERLAVGATFSEGDGGIGIIDSQAVPQSLLTEADTAHFLVLGHGQNGAGAYSKVGTQDTPCLPLNVMEGQNCAGPASTAIYRLTEVSTAEGDVYFDDSLSYFARGSISPWLASETNPTNIYFKDLSADAYVGMATSSMDVGEKAKILAIARSRDWLKVGTVCDFGGGNCTPASLIAGDVDAGTGGMKCPSGQYMVGISNNAPDCVAEVFDNCPAGEVLTGIDAGGNIECASYTPPPASCPTVTTSLCGESNTLLAGAHGVTRTITAGASRTQTFECRDGSWVSISTGGSCTCTPNSQNRTLGCGTGFTGAIYQTRTFTCPAGTWSGWTTTSNTCTCVGAVQNRTVACPAEFTGTHSQQRTFTCTTATTGTWSAWTTTSNTCTCTNRSESRTLNCTGGLSGTYQESRNFTCPSTWSAWTETSNSCYCDPETETRILPCPSGYSGQINESRNFECPSATWTGWTETSRDCTPIPPVICTWEPTGAGIDQPVRRGDRVDDECTCGDSGTCHEVLSDDLYLNYNSCSCN